LRSALAVLNEVSLPSIDAPWTEEEIARALTTFVDLLRDARAIRQDLALASHVGLAALQGTSDGRTLGAIFGSQGGEMKERWRYLQLTRNHAPFAAAPALQMIEDDEEYRYEEVVVYGLALAAANRQFAVSFTGENWDRTELTLQRCWLSEDDASGEVSELAAEVEVKHAASAAHIVTHTDFIRTLALPDPFSGADLWADRRALYPSLEFLPRVESQLSSMPESAAALRQVAQRLDELNAAAAAWVPGERPFPEWRSNVTPESEARKELCWFLDTDGEQRCFDLHARYTPGAGRIHFRLAPRSNIPRLVVAHIGRKLGA
jgi:hypothetical protein